MCSFQAWATSTAEAPSTTQPLTVAAWQAFVAGRSRQVSWWDDRPLPEKDVDGPIVGARKEPLLLPHRLQASLLGHLEQVVSHMDVPGVPLAADPAGWSGSRDCQPWHNTYIGTLPCGPDHKESQMENEITFPSTDKKFWRNFRHKCKGTRFGRSLYTCVGASTHCH